MKRNLRALGALASIAVAAATWVSPAQAVPVLSLALTPAANVAFGGAVGVDIFVSGLTGAVGAYNFDLNYDSSRMMFSSFSADPDTKMGDAADPALDLSTGNTSPLVNFNVLSGFFAPADEVTLAGLQGTGFKLGHANFTALSNAGFAAFSLANVSLSDYSGLNAIANSATGGQLCVSAPGSAAPCGGSNVPEPASALLVAAALGGLALSRRQSKAA